MMRNNIHNPQTGLLRYGIREMVELTQRIQALNPRQGFIGENIGDPLAKGWTVPPFIREILHALLDADQARAYGYTHSRGDLAARQWVAETSRAMCPASRLDPEQVLFTNGLGGAISVFYRMLRPGARILQPNPGYPAHISSERFAAGAESLGYRLDPANNWEPDMDHLESQVRAHPEAAGILLINPNNPTGTVYRRPVLEAMVELAARHKLLLISDEVYYRIVYNGGRHEHITALAGHRVPLVVMRGVSKDVPWPGARCGWMEFHNTDADDDFGRFFESVKRPLMLEVCATTLPQSAVPLIYSDARYAGWLADYTRELAGIGNDILSMLADVPGLRMSRIQGAFYMMACFEPGVLNARQTLPIADAAVRSYIAQVTADPHMPLDKRFAFHLLAATGICVVPASDFESADPGFRVTTLERHPVRRRQTYQTLARCIADYLASA